MQRSYYIILVQKQSEKELLVTLKRVENKLLGLYIGLQFQQLNYLEQIFYRNNYEQISNQNTIKFSLFNFQQGDYCLMIRHQISYYMLTNSERTMLSYNINQLINQNTLLASSFALIFFIYLFCQMIFNHISGINEKIQILIAIINLFGHTILKCHRIVEYINIKKIVEAKEESLNDDEKKIIIKLQKGYEYFKKEIDVSLYLIIKQYNIALSLLSWAIFAYQQLCLFNWYYYFQKNKIEGNEIMLAKKDFIVCTQTLIVGFLLLIVVQIRQIKNSCQLIQFFYQKYLIQNLQSNLQKIGYFIDLDYIELKSLSSINELECQICYQDFQIEERLHFSRCCQKEYHLQCIEDWISRKLQCPNCRTELQKYTKFSKSKK